MRYIGNKENIIGRIHAILKANNIVGTSFFDFFSGTTNVARFYKELGYSVCSSDIMYMSYCLQKAYIENNEEPKFEMLIPTLKINNVINSLFVTPLEIVEVQVGFLLNAQGKLILGIKAPKLFKRAINNLMDYWKE